MKENSIVQVSVKKARHYEPLRQNQALARPA